MVRNGYLPHGNTDILYGKFVYLLPLFTFSLDTGSVINGSVVLTDGEVGAFMLIQLDH